MYMAELDSVTSYCFRALDGSNYDVRCDVAKLLGHVLACSLDPPKHAISKKWVSLLSMHVFISFVIF